MICTCGERHGIGCGECIVGVLYVKGICGVVLRVLISGNRIIGTVDSPVLLAAFKIAVFQRDLLRLLGGGLGDGDGAVGEAAM